MILSRRRHSLCDARLELDRALSAGVVVRRVAIENAIQDERTTRPLGHGVGTSLQRVSVVLRGSSRIGLAGVAHSLRPGHFVRGGIEEMVVESFEGEVVEFDFAAHAAGVQQVGVLSARVVATIARLGEALRGAEERQVHTAIVSAADALSREVSPDVAAVAPARLAEDRLCAFSRVMDHTLTHLDSSPHTTDIENTLSISRRTLTRTSHAFHTRFSMSGIERKTDWRAIRDLYRSVVGAILMTNRHVTTEQASRALGYSSSAAFCHAFERRGLPSPGAIRALAGA